MKQLYKFLTACSFALLLICSSSFTAKAAEEVSTGTLTHVNPEYRNMISLSDLQQPALSTYSLTDENEPALETLTYKKAVEYVRKQMVNRNTTISVTFTHDKYLTQSVFNSFLEDIFEETDNSASTAGDYLHFHYMGCSAQYRYGYSGGSYIYEMTLTVKYMSTASEEKKVTNKINSLLKSMNLSKKTDYEKVLAIYNWITNNITYDYDSLERYERTGSIEGIESGWSAYGGLIKGTCVCQGYSTILHRMMKEAGVSSRVITGIGNGGKHAWNIVKISGKYYNVDSTWDAYDPYAGILKGTKNWFLLSNANFKYHSRDSVYETSAFNKKYPMGKSNYNPNKDTSNKKYTITYKLNGGKNSSKNPKTYTKSTATITLKNPTRTGYTFKGWYSDSKFKNKVTKISKGSTGNITLYAKWSPNKYTVSFNGNGNTNNVKISAKTYKYGTSYKLPSNTFKKKGYTFTGWNTKKDGSGKSYSNKASVKNLTSKSGGKVTLYAQWKKNK